MEKLLKWQFYLKDLTPKCDTVLLERKISLVHCLVLIYWKRNEIECSLKWIVNNWKRVDRNVDMFFEKKKIVVSIANSIQVTFPCEYSSIRFVFFDQILRRRTNLSYRLISSQLFLQFLKRSDQNRSIFYFLSN